MSLQHLAPQRWRAKALASALAFLTATMPMAAQTPQAGPQRPSVKTTRTPIQHVIVIVGENRSFDHLFATYQPKPGNTVNNLLSEGIINADGTPGPNFSLAQQYSADVTGSKEFELSPTNGKTPYKVLPPPLNGGPTDPCKDYGMCTHDDATSSENGLSSYPIDYYQFLLTGGTGLTGAVPDSRITGVTSTPPYSVLAGGPFQYTNSKSFTDDSYANSPVHRFFQMWQQEDCNASNATPTNPSGCLHDCFAWTEVDRRLQQQR